MLHRTLMSSTNSCDIYVMCNPAQLCLLTGHFPKNKRWLHLRCVAHKKLLSPNFCFWMLWKLTLVLNHSVHTLLQIWSKHTPIHTTDLCQKKNCPSNWQDKDNDRQRLCTTERRNTSGFRQQSFIWVWFQNKTLRGQNAQHTLCDNDASSLHWP